MNKTHLEIDGLIIEIIRKPIKNLHLRIYPPDGQVKISVPLKLSIDLIRRQIESKRDWILTQQARLKTTIIEQPLQFETNECHYFLGKQYPLVVHENSDTMQIFLEQDKLVCLFKVNTTLLQKQQLLQKWYRKQMTQLIPELISRWESIIPVKVIEWGIKIMKTRWGSCNTRASRIWLNLNLIKKPLECLEYVLVHEMVHLLEASHNKRFYMFMDQFLPQWRDMKKLLETTPS